MPLTDQMMCGAQMCLNQYNLVCTSQASLSWWETVSPFAGYGSTAALAFVLLAAAIKAIVEDRKRQAEDHKLNTSLTYVIEKEGGQWVEKETKWMHVKVGDIVKVRDGDLFPADLMCMHCDLPERICYVKTTNLDGETNLKVKRCFPASCTKNANLLCPTCSWQVVRYICRAFFQALPVVYKLFMMF